MRFCFSAPLALLLAALPADAAPPAIVADTPATGALVQMVLGDLGEARILLERGANAHSYQMRPSDAHALQQADMLVWTGPELTPWLTRPAGTLGPDHALVLLEIPGTLTRSYGAGGDEPHRPDSDTDGHVHDAAHASDHADRDADGDDGHGHTGVDPHAWLDPANAQLWLAAIARDLARRDPQNAAGYAANAESAAARIAELDARLSAQLRPLSAMPFVVFHDAYGYFTGHFGLTEAIAVSLGDASAPSAARIRQVRDAVATSGASCAFPEFGHDPKLIATVIEGTGARIGAPLDPHGGSQPQGADLYPEMLQQLADRLSACLTQP